MGRVWWGVGRIPEHGGWKLCVSQENASGTCVPQGPVDALGTGPWRVVRAGPCTLEMGFRSLRQVLGQIA